VIRGISLRRNGPGGPGGNVTRENGLRGNGPRRNENTGSATIPLLARKS
jgi:hypothetical protein